MSVGNDVYIPTNCDKLQITDKTESKFPNTGSDLLQKWTNKCNNKNIDLKAETFIKSTKTNSPTSSSGGINLPPIGSAFLYIETSSNSHGYERVVVSFERTDIKHFSIVTFHYNRFTILTSHSLKSMGRFRIQLLLEDNTRNTQNTIPKIDHYSNSSNDWTLLNLVFTVEIMVLNYFMIK